MHGKFVLGFLTIAMINKKIGLGIAPDTVKNTAWVFILFVFSRHSYGALNFESKGHWWNTIIYITPSGSALHGKYSFTNSFCESRHKGITPHMLIGLQQVTSHRSLKRWLHTKVICFSRVVNKGSSSKFLFYNRS